MNLSCSIVTTDDELDAITAPWATLAERSEGAAPMATPLWLRSWWRIFGGVGRRRLRVAVFREGTAIVGIVPLVRRFHWYRGSLPFRRLEWLGTGEDADDDVCSEYMAPLAEPGAERAVVRSFAAELAFGTLGEWDELVLPAMDGGSVWPSLLEGELSALGLPQELRTSGVSARIDLPKTFEDYLEALPSPSRYLVHRSMQDFDTWAGGELELKAAVSPSDLELGQSVLMSLYDERSRSHAALRSARFHAFHEQIMPALLASGTLELLWLSARGVPAAAIYNIVHNRTIYFYQGGRRLDLPKGLRPGIVMHVHAIRRSIDAGLSHYDFLGGAARDKRQLAPTSRPLVRFRVVRPSVRERVREFADQAGDGARRVFGRPNARPLADLDLGRPTAVLWGDLNMLRCFAGTGIPTLALSTDPESATFFSRHAGARRVVSDPGRDPEAAARDIAAIGRIFAERPVLFFGDDAELALVSRERNELARHYRFLLPPRELIEKLTDKSKFAVLAEELGFPIPRTIDSGEEHTLSFHVYVRADGTPLGHYVGRRIRTYPRRADASTFIELIRHPELTRIGLDVVKRLHLVGVAQLDFKLDPKSHSYHLLSINPRFNLWNHLGAVSGINLPLIAYQDLTDAPVEPRGEIVPGIRWLSFADDARAFFRDYAPGGELNALDWLRSYRGRKIYDVFAWDDPSPFVMHCLRAIRERVRGAHP